MKNIKKVLLVSLIGFCSLNVSAADVGQGKWYRFTSDFINNCIKSVQESKEASSESTGKTVSGINPPVQLSDCISSSPYLDSESQINPTELPSGCDSLENDDFVIPSGSDGQLVEMLSKDNLTKSTFECNSGSWSAKSSRTVDYRKTSCGEYGLSWLTQNGDSVYNLSGFLSSVHSARKSNCFANLPETKSGNSIILKSVTDMGEGRIKFKCNNGSWVKESEMNYASSCRTSYCPISNQYGSKVSWLDSRVTVGTEVFVEDQGSVVSGSNGYEQIKDVIKDLINEFDSNPNLKDKPVCVASIKSFDGGKTGFAEYYRNDKTLFPSEEEALSESNIIEGKGYFKCHNGKWELDESNESSICQRKTNYSCERISIGKIRGNHKYMFKCGIKEN